MKDKDKDKYYLELIKKLRYDRQMKRKRLYEQAKRANKKKTDDS